VDVERARLAGEDGARAVRARRVDMRRRRSYSPIDSNSSDDQNFH